MSSDLIAWVVAITLGVVVVVLGWRRNLGDVTRNWLPRFEGPSEPVTTRPESAAGGQRRQFSPGERRLAIWVYLGLSFGNAAMAILWSHDRPLHAIGAAVFGFGAVMFALKKWPYRQ
jgi:hypothetical protein